jgi:hypothetical protein
MNYAKKLEKSLEKIAGALSAFGDQFQEIQRKTVPDTKSTCSKFAVSRILSEIDDEAANLDETVIKMREWIEKLKVYG